MQEYSFLQEYYKISSFMIKFYKNLQNLWIHIKVLFNKISLNNEFQADYAKAGFNISSYIDPTEQQVCMEDFTCRLFQR